MGDLKFVKSNKRETMGNAPLYDAQRKILAKGKHVVITGGNTGIGYEVLIGANALVHQ